jgi:cell division transport system permease protein
MSALPADLLPRSGRRSALPWLIAAAAFLITLATSGALALGRSSDAIQAAAAGRITISIGEPDPVRREGAVGRALALLSSGGVTANVQRVAQTEVARLVSPYVRRADIPLPALIDAELRPGATIAAVRRALQPIASARVDAEGEALAPLLALVAALRRLAVGVLLLAAVVAMLVTTLVARAALAGHAGTVETLHGLGATDVQLARLVERRTALDSLVGAALGVCAAVGTILLIGAQLDTLNGGDGALPRLPASEWALLASLPFALAIATMLAARLTILGQLRRAI